MRPILYSVIIPVFMVIAGIIMLLLNMESGVLIAGAGVLWLIVSFLIGYKEDEKQPLGMGRGRER